MRAWLKAPGSGAVPERRLRHRSLNEGMGACRGRALAARCSCCSSPTPRAVVLAAASASASSWKPDEQDAVRVDRGEREAPPGERLGFHIKSPGDWWDVRIPVLDRTFRWPRALYPR
jgi:hypothetical protein